MKLHPEISPKHAAWIQEQKLFFVGTAPLSADGHVNVSPKGGDAFRVLGPLEVAYQDYTGSGAETAAHVAENGRIVLMFCAFEGAPQILRLHGQAVVAPLGSARFNELAAHFPSNPGARCIIHVTVSRVADSCGFSVPFYDYQGPRETLDRWAEKKGPEALTQYREEKNAHSIDGLPSLAAR
jgi:Pyridoxamine 5'-phosphate oxidase